MNIAMTIIVALLEGVSIGCLVHLWRQPDSLRRKLLWSVPVLVPLLGPLPYEGVHQRALPDPTSRPESGTDYAWWHSTDHHSDSGHEDGG